MLIRDFIQLTTRALTAYRMRSLLTVLGIAVGIAAVVLLTSIGEGTRQYVLAEFTQFGTHLIGINPGRVTTHGTTVGVFGSIRPLTIDDAEALRQTPHVRAAVAMVQGNAEAESDRRRRRTTVYGVGHEFPRVMRFSVASGRFLPADDPHAARAFAVLGSKLRDELYGGANPLGKRIRIGGDRYRVIGVMESKGQILGFDIDDAVYIPAAKALELFNREGLMEIEYFRNLGCYHRALEPFFERFPASNIHVAFHDDIREDPEAVLREVFEFLGVDSGFRPAGSGERINTAKTTRFRGLQQIGNFTFQGQVAVVRPVGHSRTGGAGAFRVEGPVTGCDAIGIHGHAQVVVRACEDHRGRRVGAGE